MSNFRRIPIVATELRSRDFLSVFGKNSGKRFSFKFSQYLNSKYVFSANSGTCAFYLILKAISALGQSKKEVILPAYTAASLVLPIKKLGLKVIVCDVSLETFDLDKQMLSSLVTENTLCIVAVHLFGLACNIEEIKRIVHKINSKTFIIEDCAQALGTLFRNKPVGSDADMGLFSFNRGKNISTYCGGTICTNNEAIAGFIKKATELLVKPSIIGRLGIISNLLLLSFVVRPHSYYFLYPFLNIFRSLKPPTDFTCLGYSDIQASVGLKLLDNLESFSNMRHLNGSFLYNLLKDRKEIMLARILPETRPAYNRFPVVFKDENLKNKISKAFLKKGIDSSSMYGRPVHFIFDLGYKKGAFPNAEYLAQMLLTFPTHPLVKECDLELMGNIFKDNL